MATKLIKRPAKFASDQAEADWWDAHPQYIVQQFELAEKRGLIGNRKPQQQLEDRKAARSITIRLDEIDVALARKQAEKKGLRYQTYLKMVIHQELLKEAAKAARAQRAKKISTTQAKSRKAA